MLASVLGAKLGATIAGVAVGLGGTALVAYNAAQPRAVRNTAAHTTVSTSTPTPAATTTPTSTETAVGPDAKGPAAFGLCNAWTHHQANGTQPTDSIAFRNLAVAAGGESKVAAYCAKVPHPGNAHHPTGKASGKATGKPTGKPSAKPADEPNDDPNDEPSGKPSGTPTGGATTFSQPGSTTHR
jgi:hypothetical protein